MPEPGLVGAAYRGQCVPGLASSTQQTRPTPPWLLTILPPHRRSAQPALCPVGRGQANFPLADSMLKVILCPPEQAMDTGRHCVQVYRLYSLLWGQGWVGRATSVCLPGSQIALDGDLTSSHQARVCCYCFVLRSDLSL